MDSVYSPRYLFLVLMSVILQSQLMFADANVGFANGFKIKFLCGETYHISESPLTWDGAMKNCDDNGLRLISLSSEFKQNCLAKYFKDGPVFEFWTSGSDKIEEERFRWESTREFFSSSTFSSWAPNQPDNKRGRENSVLVKFNDGENGNTQWYDESGNLEHKFICEE